MAQEPNKLDGEGDPQVGVDGSGTVCDGHGLRDEAGASRHLPIEGCGRSLKAVPEMVGLGARDAGRNRKTARADDPIEGHLAGLLAH